MSFKLRNTLFLLVLTLLLGGGGAYLNFMYFPKKITRLQNQIQQLNTSLEKIPEGQAYLKQVKKVIEERRTALSKLDKTVETKATLAEAFSYLDDIQDRYGSLKFTLSNLETKENNGFGYKVFSLNGEGTYQSIFSLIYALERGPKLFAIDDMKMRGVESAQKDEKEPLVVVPFELKARVMYADVTGLPPIKRTLANVHVPRVRNIFWPLIAKNLPPNNRDLLEAERAELRAIMPDRAILVDHAGKIRVLKVGDEVYLGYLTKINQNKNEVEFTLNKGGIVERYVLKLPFDSKEQSHE